MIKLLIIVFATVLTLTLGKPCKRSCGDSWTQSVAEAEDSVYGDKSYMCHSCINNCIHEHKAKMFGSEFDLNEACSSEKETYYKWHFGTAMITCMDDAGAGLCLKQMKFACGYDFKNMVNTAGEDCKWKEACQKWGFDNDKFDPEDPTWEPYGAEK